MTDTQTQTNVPIEPKETKKRKLEETEILSGLSSLSTPKDQLDYLLRLNIFPKRFKFYPDLSSDEEYKNLKSKFIEMVYNESKIKNDTILNILKSEEFIKYLCEQTMKSILTSPKIEEPEEPEEEVIYASLQEGTKTVFEMKTKALFIGRQLSNDMDEKTFLDLSKFIKKEQDLKFLSKLHCVILLDDFVKQQPVFKLLNFSKNYTFVDNKLVNDEPVVLNDKSLIQFKVPRLQTKKLVTVIQFRFKI